MVTGVALGGPDMYSVGGSHGKHIPNNVDYFSKGTMNIEVRNEH